MELVHHLGEETLLHRREWSAAEVVEQELEVRGRDTDDAARLASLVGSLPHGDEQGS
jgi:hypothetical protein